MRHFETILGASGFAAAGFALRHPGTLIAEETEFADAFRTAPLRGFSCPSYTPKTAEGKDLLTLLEKYAFTANGTVCVNALETVLCEFLKGKQVGMLLKAQLLNRDEALRDHTAKYYTNSGVLSFGCETLLLPQSIEKSFLSVLFHADKTPDEAAFTAVFPHSHLERAFYEGRFVLYVPVDETVGFSVFRAQVLEKWHALEHLGKILYMAPVTGAYKALHAHPVAQFEAGFLSDADSFRFDPEGGEDRV